mgnify:CR=1 FL=1
MHSPLGYSAVSDYENCPQKYKWKYLDKLQTIPSDDPQNALYIGTALHRGIEADVETAIDEYFRNFNVIDDRHILEAMKLEWLIKQAKQILPDGQHEVFIEDKNWCGTIDLISYDGDIFDFKYSNNKDHYLESRQLHLYKYYAEKKGYKIRNLYYVFFPKVIFKQKKTETLQEFRKRTMDELKNNRYISAVQVQYDPQKVIDHLELTQEILQEKKWEKSPNYFCNWCDYQNYCMKGCNLDVLPSINRVEVTINEFKKIWIYGEPFSGKTHLANEAPDPILELNTDGNVRQYTMPRIYIKDEVTVEGRQTKRKYAWERFKEAIDELEKGSDFKTIVVDLLEDVYDSCRIKVCNDYGWDHESDDSFKAWDIVRSEFLRELKRLLNLPYNIILISHEDKSKDITKKSGDKVTRIAPNIPEKIANKIAGTVDVVLRAIKEDDTYKISTKTSNVVFGGGRLPKMKAEEVSNCWTSIEEMYANSIKELETPKKADTQKKHEEPKSAEKIEEPEKPSDTTSENSVAPAEPLPTEPNRRTRRVRA